MRIASRNSRPFACRVADPVPESERLCFSLQSVTMLHPDLSNTGDPLVLLPSPCELGFQAFSIWGQTRENDVDVSRPERLLPLFGTALVRIAQDSRARGHAVLKFRRKAVERCLRNTQCLESLKAECDTHPRVAVRAFRVGSRCHHWMCAPH